MKPEVNIILVPKLISTAHKLRLGHEADGSHDFGECLDLINGILPELQDSGALMALFQNMLAAQERHDWLALADCLEYELPLLLQQSAISQG
ncbi:hypothetical protein [Shewanella sedimentimangrovi]|uniref:Orphan protein n=1 Tax=Shewanella sedimentimangrovi TaxID=2814293 RepID=A0ABX7QXE4_9GAMM|nr:hypothetical protein [Shewanella sedimentimangrovi]QSX36114.1 hypothetical protein JYB85_12300 [Shewanella sedimentimangrovi]